MLRGNRYKFNCTRNGWDQLEFQRFMIQGLSLLFSFFLMHLLWLTHIYRKHRCTVKGASTKPSRGLIWKPTYVGSVYYYSSSFLMKISFQDTASDATLAPVIGNRFNLITPSSWTFQLCCNHDLRSPWHCSPSLCLLWLTWVWGPSPWRRGRYESNRFFFFFFSYPCD